MMPAAKRSAVAIAAISSDDGHDERRESPRGSLAKRLRHEPFSPSLSMSGTVTPSSPAEVATTTRDAEPVLAPPMVYTQFLSWADFHAHVAQYGGATYQLYRVRSGTPSATRNTRMTTAEPRIPVDAFPQYAKTLLCVHGGLPRTRSMGKRRHLEIRRIQCPAKITACVRLTRAGWRVVVTSHTTTHNHDLSRERFHGYAGIRNALPPHVERAVALLHGRNTSRRAIWQYIRDTTDSCISIKDVHNLVARMDREADALLASAAVVPTAERTRQALATNVTTTTNEETETTDCPVDGEPVRDATDPHADAA